MINGQLKSGPTNVAQAHQSTGVNQVGVVIGELNPLPLFEDTSTVTDVEEVVKLVEKDHCVVRIAVSESSTLARIQW